MKKSLPPEILYFQYLRAEGFHTVLAGAIFFIV